MNNKIIPFNDVPLPNSTELTHDSSPQIIGMIHVLSNNILLGQSAWSRRLNLPEVTKKDYAYISKLNIIYNEAKEKIKSKLGLGLVDKDYEGVIALSEDLEELYETIRNLTFTGYLVERALQEVDLYKQNQVNVVQLENVGAPYFVRSEIPIVDRMLMSYISSEIRDNYPNLPMGIQMLAFGDNIALEIALRYKMFYVRGESFLFRGIRPEGSTPGSGNLAKAYSARKYLSLITESNKDFPKIYPDLMKKHTVFEAELTRLNTWFDNLGFSKLEGAIITGKHTGTPIDEADMVMAREAVDKLYETFGISIPLISGSGANIDNIVKYRKYFNAIILGSYHKSGGYWENQIDSGRLAEFMST